MADRPGGGGDVEELEGNREVEREEQAKTLKWRRILEHRALSFRNNLQIILLKDHTCGLLLPTISTINSLLRLLLICKARIH